MIMTTEVMNQILKRMFWMNHMLKPTSYMVNQMLKILCSGLLCLRVTKILEITPGLNTRSWVHTFVLYFDWSVHQGHKAATMGVLTNKLLKAKMTNETPCNLIDMHAAAIVCLQEHKYTWNVSFGTKAIVGV